MYAKKAARLRAERIRMPSTFREFPNAECIPSENQLAVVGTVEVQRAVNELQFFVQRNSCTLVLQSDAKSIESSPNPSFRAS